MNDQKIDSKEQFFNTALVKENEILCVIHGKVVVITEDRFAGVFELPTEGLTDFSEVPKNLAFDARSLFSQSREPNKTSCKKRKMKHEFLLLNDILANSMTVKAGSFNAVTHERFVLMTAIHFDLKVNWSKLLFDTLKEMADKSSKRAKGYAAQICVLLKGDLVVTLEEAKTFPPLKILSAKTVGTYVATNKTIDARGESDEPDVDKVAVVKRKYVSKKRSASTSNKDTNEVQVEIVVEKTMSKKRPAAASDAPVVKKKRTATGRASPTEKYMALVTVAQNAVPIQIIEPISAVPAERPHDQKRKAPKKKLRLSTGSDDEIFETEPDVENVVEKQKEQSAVDYVDKIIDQVLTETTKMEKDVVEPDVAEGGAMGKDLAEPVVTRSDDIVVEITERSIAVNDEDDNLDGAENEISRTMASIIAPKQFLKEPLRSGEDDDIYGVEQPNKIIDTEEDSVKNKETDIQLVETVTGKEIDPEPVAEVGQISLDEESLSIDDLLKRIPADMMLPSVIAAEPTKIKFGHGITIRGVVKGDWYKKSLPKIAVANKGKVLLVEPDTVKWHAAHEMVQLICGDIEFLVQLRERVIYEVAAFFNSFSLRRLAVLKSVRDIAAKEEQVLTWAETDFVQVALQRRLYIVAKYRELLLRKFFEAHRANFSFGQPWSAMVLHIIDLLSTAYSSSVKNLLTQKQALKLEWTRPCCAMLFEGANIDRGFL
ncbi:splicing factor 3B subunit 1-like [Dorcoceras hygrometricum]|uniref:Splicing factor 3B subunit 1-like n=1 Tax=Dorcoceras hygrometricum TaxID=472368 RepID=A0A2Z7B701_9LAMI|nr:splicing factor 3B subunit 1-like [Dorcoceras hygrometricum]